MNTLILKKIKIKIYIIKKLNHDILIEIDTSKLKRSRGPGAFLKGIYEALPFYSNNCLFISSSIINFIFKPDYYYFPIFTINENDFNKLIQNKIIHKYILGPNFVPQNWFLFPNREFWVERRFSEILNVTKAIAVHSKRISKYLIERSNTTNNIRKFKIVKACTNLNPKKINSFKKRKIDILFFEKYADLNRRKQGRILLNLFKNTSKRIESIKYGGYNKNFLKQLANNSKFITVLYDFSNE